MKSELYDIAEDIFYKLEAEQFSTSDSPWPDSYRLVFIMGFVQGYRFLNDNGQKCDQNLLKDIV